MNPPNIAGSRLDRIAAPLLCVLVLAVFADVVFMGQRLFVRDVASYYYPTQKIVSETFLNGELPLWNRAYGAGQPMAANPEYAVFYPPRLLLLLPGYDFWFQLLILLHVAAGATGMYRLLRSFAVSGTASLYGAIAFGFGGLVGSLMNLLPYLFILAWVPWAFMWGRRWILTGERRALALAGVASGMQILTAEPSTLVQVWLVIGFYVLFVMGDRSSSGKAMRYAARLVALFVLSVAIGAVQLLPAIDHVGDSVRSLPFSYETVVSWSAPPLRPVELLLPGVFGRAWFAGEGGYWGSVFYSPRPLPFLFSIYLGFPILVLAVAGLLKGGRVGRWVGLSCAACFVLAIGGATPLYRALYDWGPGQSFRYPEKFLLAALITLVIFGAWFLGRAGEHRRLVSRVGVVLALVGLAVSVGAVMFLSGSAGLVFASSIGGATTADGAVVLREALRCDWFLNAARFVVFGILFGLLARGMSIRRWTVALVVVGFIDLAVGLRAVTPSIEPGFFDEPPVASVLDDDRSDWRVFPLANWYQAHGRSLQGMRFSETGEGAYWTVRNGMAPMLLSGWGFGQAMEIDYDRTSLIPTTEFLRAMWEIRNEVGDERDSTLMAMSNARYVTRFRDYETEVARSGSIRQATPVDYIEIATNPRYYIPDRIETIDGRDEFVRRMVENDPGPGVAFVTRSGLQPGACTVRDVSEGVNSARIDVDCAERSLLVASVTPHRYWSAVIDGDEAEILRVNLGYTGVEIPAGEHVVAFEYRNPVVAAGGVVTLVALLLSAVLAIRGRAEHRNG